MADDFDPRRARGKRPMPIWWDAFLRDTMEMEADEVGAYMLLLGAMWTRRSCDLPNDPRKLSRIARVSLSKWKSRVGPAVLNLLDVTDDAVISWRLRKEAVFVQMTVTKQRCKRTGENSANLLKGLDWGLTAVKTADKPRQEPTQQPNNPTKENTSCYGNSGNSPLFGGQEKKRPPPKKISDPARVKLIQFASEDAVDGYLAFRKTTKAKGTTARAATLIANQLSAIIDQGGNPDEALDMAQLQGWQGLHADWYFNKKRQDNGNSNHNSGTVNGGRMAGSETTAEIADRATRYAQRRTAERRDNFDPRSGLGQD